MRLFVKPRCIIYCILFSIYLFQIWKYHEGLKHSFNSSPILQGFKSMQLRMVGPGLVGLGLLLTLLRVLLCIVPPYINRCRQGKSWIARNFLSNKNALQAGEGEERDQENWLPKTSRPCLTAVLYRLVILSYKQEMEKSFGNRDLMQGTVPFENLLKKGTFFMRFQWWRECVATDIVEIFLPPAKRCIFLHYTRCFFSNCPLPKMTNYWKVNLGLC